jgi:hypothetical protein
MIIEEGKSSNYLIHGRYGELAIVDSSDPMADSVVVIPDARLKGGGLIQSDLLPFDVEVHKTNGYMPNSRLVKPETSQEPNAATAGAGLERLALPKPEVTGTDPEQKMDFPSIYVTLKRKADGQDMGTYLFSALLDPQPVDVDGKKYEVALRYKRTYTPYAIHLHKFTHDLYPGTDKPKDFAAEITLIDPSRNEQRDVRIWMNHPLRYQGETFYQSSFLEGDQGTILQVVRNPGWLMPYISCGMVALGMLVHFGINLVGFLRGVLRARVAT